MPQFDLQQTPEHAAESGFLLDQALNGGARRTTRARARAATTARRGKNRARDRAPTAAAAPGIPSCRGDRARLQASRLRTARLNRYFISPPRNLMAGGTRAIKSTMRGSSSGTRDSSDTAMLTRSSTCSSDGKPGHQVVVQHPVVIRRCVGFVETPPRTARRRRRGRSGPENPGCRPRGSLRCGPSG